MRAKTQLKLRPWKDCERQYVDAGGNAVVLVAEPRADLIDELHHVSPSFQGVKVVYLLFIFG